MLRVFNAYSKPAHCRRLNFLLSGNINIVKLRLPAAAPSRLLLFIFLFFFFWMTSEKFGAGSFWVNWQTIQRNVWKVEQKKTKKVYFWIAQKTVTFLTVLKNWLNFYLTTQSACQPTNHSLSKINKQMNSWKMRHDSIRTTIDLNMCIRVCVCVV